MGSALLPSSPGVKGSLAGLLSGLLLVAACSRGSAGPTVTIRVRGTVGAHVSGAYITRSANGAVAMHVLAGTLPLLRTVQASEVAFYVSSDVAGAQSGVPVRNPLSAGLDRRPQRGPGDSIAVISADPLPPPAAGAADGTPPAETGATGGPLSSGPLTVAVSTSCDPSFLARLPLPKGSPNTYPPPPALPSPCDRPVGPGEAPGSAGADGGSPRLFAISSG